jgi:hypothetical protein
MRDWALEELHGYSAWDKVPDYRRVPAALMALITNRAGYNGVARRFDESVFPQQIRQVLKDVDLEEAVLSHGIGQLEAMAREGSREHTLIPPWAGVIVDFMNKYDMAVNGRVAEVFLSVSNVAIENVLVRIRTTLVELAAELISLTPEGQEVPDRVAVDQVTQFVMTGDRSVINYIVQQASGGGTNVSVNGGGAGPVTVAGGSGSAIGSQTASGANSSVVGSQEASGAGPTVVGGQSSQAGGDAAVAGHDAAVRADREQPAREGWWARLRKRGVVVAFATIIGAIAGIAAVVVTIMIAAGWKP